ncbi:hypothetical protein IQ277_34155, partial [Nostocales cyanobacterium LEGE 12452]|nr:hypothetical protein [Nostocales cyanobacterium LEGE 12452]
MGTKQNRKSKEKRYLPGALDSGTVGHFTIPKETENVLPTVGPEFWINTAVVDSIMIHGYGRVPDPSGSGVLIT